MLMKAKHTIHIILTELFVVQATNNSFVFSFFKINQSYFEKYPYFNSDMPNSEYHAHCQSKNRLNKGQKANGCIVNIKEESEWAALFINQKFHFYTQAYYYSLAFSARDKCGSIAAPFQPSELITDPIYLSILILKNLCYVLKHSL